MVFLGGLSNGPFASPFGSYPAIPFCPDADIRCVLAQTTELDRFGRIPRRKWSDMRAGTNWKMRGVRGGVDISRESERIKISNVDKWPAERPYDTAGFLVFLGTSGLRRSRSSGLSNSEWFKAEEIKQGYREARIGIWAGLSRCWPIVSRSATVTIADDRDSPPRTGTRTVTCIPDTTLS